jgi:hypothetical protein
VWVVCPLFAAQGFVDLYNYLLRQRIIFLSGYVNDKVSNSSIYVAVASAEPACGSSSNSSSSTGSESHRQSEQQQLVNA